MSSLTDQQILDAMREAVEETSRRFGAKKRAAKTPTKTTRSKGARKPTSRARTSRK